MPILDHESLVPSAPLILRGVDWFISGTSKTTQGAYRDKTCMTEESMHNDKSTFQITSHL